MFKPLPYRAQPSKRFELCRLQVNCGSVANVAHSRRTQGCPAETTSLPRFVCGGEDPEKADTTRAVRVID